jgi:hypothetical protein
MLPSTFFLLLLFLTDGEQDHEKRSRIEAGNNFLTSARINRWEEVLTKGVESFGKVVSKNSKRKMSECWIQPDFAWFKSYDTAGKVTIDVVNPSYSARIVLRNGVYSLSNVGGPMPEEKILHVSALPFALTSSVCYFKSSTAFYLKSGKLEVRDYRKEGPKHYVQLGFNDDSQRKDFEIVFDDDTLSLLPSELRFKNLDRETHTKVFDFFEVNGYTIPRKLTEEGNAEVAVTEVFPDERLDTKTCYLSYYGLPEPPAFKTTDFGPSGSNVYLYVSAALIAVGVTIWLLRGRSNA